jgi:Cu+-exporting ATPase
MKVQQASLTSASPQDPVCGMDVNPAKAMGRAEYKGKTYYFCSDRCKRKFAASPEAFIH